MVMSRWEAQLDGSRRLINVNLVGIQVENLCSFIAASVQLRLDGGRRWINIGKRGEMMLSLEMIRLSMRRIKNVGIGGKSVPKVSVIEIGCGRIDHRLVAREIWMKASASGRMKLLRRMRRWQEIAAGDTVGAGLTDESGSIVGGG
jgi:hypothetical protein